MLRNLVYGKEGKTRAAMVSDRCSLIQNLEFSPAIASCKIMEKRLALDLQLIKNEMRVW